MTSRLLDRIAAHNHPNGTPVFEVYGPGTATARGGTVTFNVLGHNGRVLPYEDVECAAGERDIAVRGGCFCNPGAAEAAFRFPAGETLECLRRASASGFTPRKFAECLSNETPAGAIRVSVGAATSEADVDRCIDTLAGLALCA